MLLICRSNLDWTLMRQKDLFSLASWEMEEWELAFENLHCTAHRGMQVLYNHMPGILFHSDLVLVPPDKTYSSRTRRGETRSRSSK